MLNILVLIPLHLDSFAIAIPTVMASRILLNLRGLNGESPDPSELTTASQDILPTPGGRYQHGALAGRARILPTLTQWTVSGEETMIARLQEEAEKYVDNNSPPSSVDKGKGREIDIEMSPVSSSGKSPIAPVLPHDTHFGRLHEV
jgi:hypothetical protein